jgi:hypothetical protein
MRELHWHPSQDEWSYFLYVLLPLLLNICLTRITGRAMLGSLCSHHRVRPEPSTISPAILVRYSISILQKPSHLSTSIAYIPATYGHYVENIGNTTLHYLEIFKTDTFQDISLSQVCFFSIWLGLLGPDTCWFSGLHSLLRRWSRRLSISAMRPFPT